MQNLKFTLIVFFIGLTVQTSWAQLTQRYANDSAKVSFATRPKKGDKSLMLAIHLRDSSLKMVKPNDLLKLSESLVFRKYIKDNLVFRISAKVQRQSKVTNGILADSSFYNPLTATHLTENKLKVASNTILVAPWLEKHFSNKNIFDVYYGAAILVGFNRGNSTQKILFSNGDYTNRYISSFDPLLGITPYAGFNIFIKKLPISVGLEYSWTGLWSLGNRMKVSKEDQFTTGNTAQTYATNYFAQTKDVFNALDNNHYAKLNRREFDGGLNQVIKLTTNIYFK